MTGHKVYQAFFSIVGGSIWNCNAPERDVHTQNQQYRTWLRDEQDHVFRKPHSFSEKNRQDHRSRPSKKGNGETGPALVTKPGVPKHVEKESIEPLMVIPKISLLLNQRKSTFEEQLQEIDMELDRDRDWCMGISRSMHGKSIDEDAVIGVTGPPGEQLADVANSKLKKSRPTWKRVCPKHTDVLHGVSIFSIVGSKRPNPDDFNLEQTTAPEHKKGRGDRQQGDTNALMTMAVAGEQPRCAQ
ncbi:hypothetical protein FCV25MIE_29191 [Fagus crenata]